MITRRPAEWRVAGTGNGELEPAAPHAQDREQRLGLYAYDREARGLFCHSPFPIRHSPLVPMASKASLLTIFLTVFIDLLGFGIVLPLLPIFARQYSHDESGVTIGLLMSSFSAMQFLFAP